MNKPLVGLLLLGAIQGVLCCTSVSCNTPYNTHPPLPNRTPDKIDLGRSTWLYLHTTVAYFPVGPLSNKTISEYEGLLGEILATYPCLECRSHFNDLVSEQQIMADFTRMKDHVDAVLFLWKLHNAVTSRQSPEKDLYGSEELSKAGVLSDVVKEDFATFNMYNLDPTLRNSLYEKVQKRWGKVVKVKSNKPSVVLWVMAACPFGHLTEQRYKQIVDLMGDKFDFKVKFILMSSSSAWPAGTAEMICIDGGQYCSMHGSQEVNEDARQLALFADQGEAVWWKYALAFNNLNCEVTSYDQCSSKAAASVGITIPSLTHNEQTSILANGLRETLDNGVEASPTIFVNGQEYGGLKSTDQFLADLCSHYETPPPECSHKFGSDSVPVNAGHCGIAVPSYGYGSVNRQIGSSQLVEEEGDEQRGLMQTTYLGEVLVPLTFVGLGIMLLGVTFLSGMKAAEYRLEQSRLRTQKNSHEEGFSQMRPSETEMTPLQPLDFESIN